jgi:hypothetical protein
VQVKPKAAKLFLRYTHIISNPSCPFLRDWDSARSGSKRQVQPQEQIPYRMTSEQRMFANQESCYVPYPRTSFATGSQVRLKCVICQETDLLVRSPGQPVDDSTPSILPCGHVFGSQCLESWLKMSSRCPLCRLALPASYELCPHPCKPRVITGGTVESIPPTLAQSSSPRYADQCVDCRFQTILDVAICLLEEYEGIEKSLEEVRHGRTELNGNVIVARVLEVAKESLERW